MATAKAIKEFSSQNNTWNGNVKLQKLNTDNVIHIYLEGFALTLSVLGKFHLFNHWSSDQIVKKTEYVMLV